MSNCAFSSQARSCPLVSPLKSADRATSYVATAMIGVRKLRNLPAQAN
ncbi:DUF4060 family protein [Salmonella enterica]|nr:DUF4060 family protein [Salmonella enterica]